MPRSKWIWVFVSLPLLILILFILRFRVEAPLADEWNLVPLIDKLYKGTLQFKDLWALHNEHRLLFPRMLLLVLVHIGHWTMLYELLVIVAFALVTFFAVLFLLKKIHFSPDVPAAWLTPVFSFMFFSLNQSENWFFGWNVQIFMSVAAVTLGLILVGGVKISWPRLIAAAALGIVATYSFANGFLFWPLAILLLWQERKSLNHPVMVFAFWIAVAAISFFSYLVGYTSPGGRPSPWSFLHDPVSALNYTFAYLGSPLMAFCKKAPFVAQWLALQGFIVPKSIQWLARNSASFAGLFGVMIFVFAYFRLRGHESWKTLMIFFALAAYALLSAILSTIGRSGLGIESALSLRYVTISTLFWISLILFLAVGAGLRPDRPPRIRAPEICIGLILFCLLLNSIYGALYAVKIHNYLMPARAELLRMQDENLLERLYPDVDYIRKSVPVMQRYRLSVFREKR